MQSSQVLPSNIGLAGKFCRHVDEKYQRTAANLLRR
jgi:hypothetical protein